MISEYQWALGVLLRRARPKEVRRSTRQLLNRKYPEKSRKIHEIDVMFAFINTNIVLVRIIHSRTLNG